MTDTLLPGEGEQADHSAATSDRLNEGESLSFKAFEPFLREVVSEEIGIDFRDGLPEGVKFSFVPEGVSEATGTSRYAEPRLELVAGEKGVAFYLKGTDINDHGEFYVRHTTGLITPDGLDNVSRGELGKRPRRLDTADKDLEAEVFAQVNSIVDNPAYSLTMTLRGNSDRRS